MVGTDLSVSPDLIGQDQQYPRLNPLYPQDIGAERDPVAPQTQYNTLRPGLPPYGTAQPLTYYSKPPGNVSAAEVPPMAPIHDVTAQAGFGTKFGRYNTNPVGMVIHHTGGGTTVDQVLNVYKERGYPANFVIDKQGNIYQALPNGYQGRHIIGGTGLLGTGRSNANMEGVEIIANNDKDVNDAQRASAANLIAQRGAMWGYNPITSTFGHGEVNPPKVDTNTGRMYDSHREPSEGFSVTNGIRDGSIPVPDYSKQIRPVAITAAPGSAPAAPFADVSSYPQTIPVNAAQGTEARSIPGYVLSADGKTWQRADTLSDPTVARSAGVFGPNTPIPNMQQMQQPQAQTYTVQPGGSPFAQMSNINLPSPAASLSLPPNMLTTPQPQIGPQATQVSEQPEFMPGGAY